MAGYLNFQTLFRQIFLANLKNYAIWCNGIKKCSDYEYRNKKIKNSLLSHYTLLHFDLCLYIFFG